MQGGGGKNPEYVDRGRSWSEKRMEDVHTCAEEVTKTPFGKLKQLLLSFLLFPSSRLSRLFTPIEV